MAFREKIEYSEKGKGNIFKILSQMKNTIAQIKNVLEVIKADVDYKL